MQCLFGHHESVCSGHPRFARTDGVLSVPPPSVVNIRSCLVGQLGAVAPMRNLRGHFRVRRLQSASWGRWTSVRRRQMIAWLQDFRSVALGTRAPRMCRTMPLQRICRDGGGGSRLGQKCRAPLASLWLDALSCPFGTRRDGQSPSELGRRTTGDQASGPAEIGFRLPG
jgi:hypothetical protein